VSHLLSAPFTCFAAVCLASAGPAVADVSISYLTPQGEIFIEANDAHDLRVTFDQQRYLLFSESRAYLSRRTGRQVHVDDLTSIAAALHRTGSATRAPASARSARPQSASARSASAEAPAAAIVTSVAARDHQACGRPEGNTADRQAGDDASAVIEHLACNVELLKRIAGFDIIGRIAPMLLSVMAVPPGAGGRPEPGGIRRGSISRTKIVNERFTLAALPGQIGQATWQMIETGRR
jgi:hypothetical protein